MSLEAKSIWRLIKFSSPTKWKQEPWGEKGQGFWVVATFSNHCIYFNDIENGFNISKFEKLGIINDYWCNQDELNQVLERLADPDFTP